MRDKKRENEHEDDAMEDAGGDKGREKKEKSSKSGKSGKGKKQSGKSGVDASKISSDTQKTPGKLENDVLNGSKESLDPKRPDLSVEHSSDEASFVSGDLISNDPTIKSDDDYKSMDEDFPADCSNLTGYLETAILESACNTLERNNKLHIAVPAVLAKIEPREIENMEVAENMDGNSTGEPKTPVAADSAFDAGLYVEYVNYDLLGADDGGGSSGEYYSSEDEATTGQFLNSNNNSNHELNLNASDARGESLQTQRPIAAALANNGPGQHTGSGDGDAQVCDSNNIPESSYYGNNEGSRDNKPGNSTAEEKGPSLGELERNEYLGNDDGNSSEKQQRSIDHSAAADSQGLEEDFPDGHYYNAQDLGHIQQFEQGICPVHHGNVDLTPSGNTREMEKARVIFGMCLCQNGEQVDNVNDLDFRNCNLKQVPHDIFQYAQTLTHLQLDSNTLSDLPKSLFSCENLEYLTVSDNDLGSLPPTLAGLANLKYLDISKNVIEDVPDCIRCCKSLSVLDASVNPIERLSEGFTQLVGLNELYLNDCFLEFLPANFGRLIQLSVLELRDNQLQILPKSIRRLNLLKRLDLGGNIFQEWPDVVCELRKLTELWLDGNELSKVPEEIGELSSLVYLDLSRNFIETIPSQIGSLRELQDLLLCENHITALPDTIGFLNKLTMLKASMNQLTGVPESIGKLREIEELDLSHNKLIDIPSSIGNLTEMHTLLLDNNVLSSVPPELGRCGRLNVFQLSRNMLIDIPREIGDLSQLRVFNICRNRLPHLPITVIKLSQLEALWVSSNQSKPNVPLHAELGPDGKTRILTNILFPQVEQDSVKIREKTDEEGYANDAADDDEPALFRKQRGVTRVAFNLQPVEHEDEDDLSDLGDDENMGVDVPLIPRDQNSNDKFPLNDHHHAHSVDVSAEVISTNGNGLRIQPTLMVRSPGRSEEMPMENGNTTFDICPEPIPMIAIDSMPNTPNWDAQDRVMEWSQGPPAYNDLLNNTSVANTPSVTSEVDNSDVMDSPLPNVSNEDGNLKVGPESPKAFSVPDLSKPSPPSEEDITDTSKSTPAVDNVAAADDDDDPQAPKMKTWSSHSHLPAIPSTESMDVVRPVAAEIISNRSSMSSSPSLAPEELQKPESNRISRLPIPSRALFDQTNAKQEEIRKDAPSAPEVPQKSTPVSSPKPPGKSGSLSDIPFMDSDVSDDSNLVASENAPLITKPKKVKPPPPPRKDSLLSKNATKSAEPSPTKPPVPPSKPTLSSATGLKIFTPALLQRQKYSETDGVQDPALLALPSENKPPSETSPDGLPSTDRDSGVGNDVDSQESIPECPDEDLPPPPPEVTMENPPQRPTLAPKPTVKSVANFQVADVRKSAPGKAESKPTPSYAPIILPPTGTQPPPIAPKPPAVRNKISANIKMFESISTTTEQKANQLNSRSLADLLPTGPRKTEEKAIIRPNNHLNGFVNEKTPENKPEVTSLKDIPLSPVKPTSLEFNGVISERQQQEQPVMFLRNDDDVIDDASAFSKALSEMTSSPEKKKISRSNSKTDSGESAKQTQFRERLEKIMQQQKSVSAATKAAQGGTALSLSRKASFKDNYSQPTSPDGSGLEKLTAESAFAVPEYPVTPVSPEQKQPNKKSVHDRMKNKLDRGSNPVKSASSSRIATRARPGSAPAAQLLQRCNSTQRNSIAAPEGNEKRTLAPLYPSDERTGMDPRSRSKSIEQQLGMLFLDSDEERLNHDERMNYERHHHDDVTRREHRLKRDSGIRGSRSSLCSPPPVRHNMYNKARSSTNTASAPLADWKHKLLQHIERKRVEKQQVTALQSAGRQPRTQQPQRSIGRIKSPPRTSAPKPKQQQAYYDGSNYVTVNQPQPRRDPHSNHRQMGKSVTVPSLMAPTKTSTNTHQYNPDGPGVRSHFAGNSRASKLAKQRTFTPGPENHGNVQMMAPRPKSAMEKYSTQPPVEPSYAEPPSYRQAPQPALYADLRTYKQPPLPSYEDHLHRRVTPHQHENNAREHRLVRSESARKSLRGANYGRVNYEDLTGYPLRQSGSHESLMDPTRYNQHDPYFPSTPLRNASSHDSVLDQPPYQPASYAPAYYSPPPQQQRYPPNHIPQRHPVPERPKRGKYNSPDYATYVNVYDYDRSPVEYHNRPQIQDAYRSQMGYRGSVRGDSRPHKQQQQDPSNYSNYAYPPSNYHNPRQPPTYEQHYTRKEPLSPTLYRPLAEREEESVASAFRPYNQVQQPIQPQQRRTHHHGPYMHSQPYGLPPNQVMSPTEYKNPGRHMSPPSNYQYMPEQPRHLPRPPPGWADQQEDFERVTVSVRRNPTFGFHVMGGVGAGGNPYRPVDDGVFVTHVSPGGAADNKLQAGDKILLVNGSDFVGISHKRAVDLLRNAGQVAVLVVERSLGKPV